MISEQPVLITPKPTLDTESILKQVNREGEFLQFNRYEVEEDAVFVNYEMPGLLQKLADYSKLTFYQRQSYAKHLVVIREEVIAYKYEQEQQNLLKQFMFAIIRDTEEIKRCFITQVKPLIQNISKSLPNTLRYRELKEVVAVCLTELLKIDLLDLKEEAARILASIASVLSQTDRSEIILREAISLTQSENQQNKMVGVQLLTKLAFCLPQQQCDEFVAKQILVLGEHQSVRVKKQAILCLPLLATCVSKPFFEKNVLEFYTKKSSESSWAVRKACADIIYELAKECSTEQSKQQLQHWMLNFLKDGNKIVRVHAHKVLPMFITTITVINPLAARLVECYLKLLESEVNNQMNSNELAQKMAYCFPAVLLTLGKDKWKQLQPIYHRLLKNTDKNVKIPLGCSLHEVGKVIGAEQSKLHLFTCLDNILKDHCDELKLGAIEHLSEFVSLFNKETRENLIDVFLVLQKDPRKWRIRYSIAEQLDRLAKIYDLETLFQYILPISFKLCNDPVSEVRTVASNNIWIMVEMFKDSETYLYVTMESIKGFAYSKKFNQRQSFVTMCKKIWKYEQVFTSEIIPCLEKLAQDHVTVVRIMVAELVCQIQGKLRQNTKIQVIQLTLQQDQQQDVRQALCS